MAKCAFCQAVVKQGDGKMFVKVNGDILYFCNSKCQKNFRLGRQGKDFKWTGTSLLKQKAALEKTGASLLKQKAAPKNEPAVEKEGASPEKKQTKK